MVDSIVFAFPFLLQIYDVTSLPYLGLCKHDLIKVLRHGRCVKN